MGYYTWYNLRVIDVNSIGKNPLDEIPPDVLEYITSTYDIRFDRHGNPVDLMKWYEHDEDLFAISQRFKYYIFVLSGEGEDRDDNWRTYYCNGFAKGSRAHLVYDEVDLDELASHAQNIPGFFD